MDDSPTERAETEGERIFLFPEDVSVSSAHKVKRECSDPCKHSS